VRRVFRWIGLAFALLLFLHVANLAALHWRHHQAFGYFAPLGLHADAEIEGSQDPILRAVVVANFGLLPTKVRVCHALTDINDPISFIEFIIEEWNPKLEEWRPSPNFRWDSFCKGIATSHGDGKIRNEWLLPGQELREETGVRLRNSENSQTPAFRLRLPIVPGNPEPLAIFTASIPAQ
jgi:hypothetical protein